MAVREKKYYAYIVPEKNVRGVAESWAECEKMVKGIAGARFRGFKTRAEAESWLGAGAVYEKKEKKIMELGIYFDAGTGRGNGVEIKVTDEKGKGLLHKILPKAHINRHGAHGLYDATNNYGELLACKYAIQIAIQENIKKVFGDSKLIIEYWSLGYIKRNEVAPQTVTLAGEVAILRKQFETAGGVVLRISGDDNPADLGFHR